MDIKSPAKTAVPKTEVKTSSSSSSLSSSSSSSSDTKASSVTEWKLEKENELRFEVADLPADSPVTIKLLTGTAEVFGAELEKGVEYKFNHCKSAVFTWHGCRLEVKGKLSHSYVASESPSSMVCQANVHAALEKLRQQKDRPTGGPRVLIVGGTDSGKSSLTRVLTNYATRSGWFPTLVDLDVGQNSVSVPGTVAAIAINKPIAVDGNPYHFFPPIAYYYGSNTPTTAPELYKKVVERLALAIDTRTKDDAHARQSGIIINTCGLVEGLGYELIIHAAVSFKVDVLLVLGHDRLENDLKQDKRLKNVAIAKLAKSGGVVERNPTFRQKTRDRAIRSYFYGHNNDLHPHTQVLNFKEFSFFRMSGGPKVSEGMLPIGVKPRDPSQLERITRLDKTLEHKVLGVSYAKDQTGLLTNNVAGFVFVQSIDVKKDTFTVLSPSPGALPSQYLLVGDLRWHEFN